MDGHGRRFDHGCAHAAARNPRRSISQRPDTLPARAATVESSAMNNYSKNIKRLLREYMTEAYERELHRELTKLDQSFAQWRAGAISSGELSHRIHQYETGPSRELYKQYNESP